MTSKEALEIAIKEVYKVLNGIDKRLNEGSLEFGDYKYYNSPEELKKALDKHSKYISAIEKLTSIKKDLDRLEKLEKSIDILKKALLVNVKEVNGFYYVCGYDNNYFMTKKEYNLLKEVLENE